MGDGQLSNVANPHAAGALNQALGPAVLHTLQDALQSAGDFANTVTPAAADSSTASTAPATGAAPAADETILSGGDVAEVADKATKRIPLSQAPPQLQKALAGDVLKGLGQ